MRGIVKRKKNKIQVFCLRKLQLIYSVDNKNEFIKIAAVFDTRQHPPKLKRTK